MTLRRNEETGSEREKEISWEPETESKTTRFTLLLN